MSMQWMIETRGDPLGSVKKFVHTIWEQCDLDGMLVPLNGTKNAATKPQLIQGTHTLEKVNPFKPLMMANAAGLIPELVQENPDKRLGAMLRPCEMRALIEMGKRDSFTTEDFLTISVDCLGTYPLEEYQWRAARKEAADGLTQEALQFARQGGIVPYRYRSVCQICVSPEASGADINIHVLGLPARQHILVSARDDAAAARFQLDVITAGEADEDLVDQHERVVARTNERHWRTMERVRQNLGEMLPKDVDAIVEQFEGCASCQNCMDACPICVVDFPQQDAEGQYLREDVKRWLISCAGCGMCEQSCTNHLPLGIIFGHIRQLLADEYGYTAGRSMDEPLPIL